MAINKHEHFESHMNISSPETNGDAEKIELFFEDAYDDLFDKRFAYLDTLEYNIPNRTAVVPDGDDTRVAAEHKYKHDTVTVSNRIYPHLGNLLQHRNNEHNHDTEPQYIPESGLWERNKSGCTDTTKSETISIQGSFDALPENRRASIYSSFEGAPNEIKCIINRLSNELSVDITLADDSHYDLIDKIIRMEENLDNSEYVEVFSHEYGHFVDNKLGDTSESTAFREAIVKDLEKYDRSTKAGMEYFNKMIGDLINSDAAFDMAVSDNMSAFFQNDPEIIKLFTSEGIAYYGHDNDYWAISGTREAEIYANSFSMLAQNNEASCEFMKKHFPHTWEQFMHSLQGGLE